MKRIRGAFTALVVLALSATAVFASRALPATSSSGLSQAATSSGQTVPVRAGDEQGAGAQNAPDTDDTDTDTDKNESQNAESATHPDNHGKVVSEAAQLTVDQIKALNVGTFANHGAYVSSVAEKNAGHGNKPSSPGKSGSAGPH